MTNLDNARAGLYPDTFAERLQLTPENQFVPMYLAFVLSHFLLGISCSQYLNQSTCPIEQVWTYYSCFPNDPRWVKRLVGLAFSLSIFKVIMSSMAVGRDSLVALRNQTHDLEIDWTLSEAPLAATLVLISAQFFFVWRCYALTGRNRYVLVGLITLILTELAASVGFSVLVESRVKTKIGPSFALWALIVIPIGLDVIITLTVSYKLLSAQRGENRNTDTLLARLFAVTWHSALPPTLVQLGGIIHFAKVPGASMWNYLANELSASLYVVSLLYTLNSRLEIRGISRLMRPEDYAGQMPTGRNATASGRSSEAPRPRQQEFEQLGLVPLRHISPSVTTASLRSFLGATEADYDSTVRQLASQSKSIGLPPGSLQAKPSI